MIRFQVARLFGVKDHSKEFDPPSITGAWEGAVGASGRVSRRVLFHLWVWSSISGLCSGGRHFLLLACSIGVQLVRCYFLTLGGLLRVSP